MAASHTLPHVSAIPQISKLGVLTLYGYGIRITMQSGHLQIEDGIADDRYRIRLPRVNHRLKRLVCIGDDGFITLAALRWLSEVGASFVMLDRLGKVRVITGPTSPSESRLRRAQALALSNGNACQIARELIARKLQGQEILVREKLHSASVADSIAALRTRLSETGDLNVIRGIESRAAAMYWDTWRDVLVLFPRQDIPRVPSHWLSFGTRCSPLTGGPRLAVNPANALLNYTNAIPESECRLAARACGLDPGLGFLHTDAANRDSLALDLIETIRPAIEAWLLDWLQREPLRKSDFAEANDGNCRLSSLLCSKLSQTAPTWRKLIAPWAEYVAHSLYGGRKSRDRCVPGVKTPLTQKHRREAKGSSAREIKMPKTEHVCRGCGTPIREDHEECWNCAQSRTTRRIGDVAKIGRMAARRPEARAKLSQSARLHAVARYSWDASKQPPWLTREFFLQRIRPLLPEVSASKIRSTLTVSHFYANRIRKGYIPHPRHWEGLAGLLGIRAESTLLQHRNAQHGY